MTDRAPTSVEALEQLQLVMEAAPNAMLVANSRGEIVVANAEACRSFGYTSHELLVLKVDDLVPAASRGHHAELRDRFFDEPQRRGMGAGRDLHGVRKDGSAIPVEIGLNPILIAGETHVLASIIDITERLYEQTAAEDSRRAALVRSILTTLPMSVIATDQDGLILSANPATERMLGYGPGELVGRNLSEVDGIERRRSVSGTAAATDIAHPAERVYRRRDGETLPVDEEVVILRDEQGDERGYLAVAYDITQRIQSRERVQHMLRHDPLTDLPNRLELLSQLNRILEQATYDGTQAALLLLDLDHFKRVNDTLGHDVGDDLLQQVAQRLMRWVRADDIVARLGGDEFVIVLTGLAPDVDLSLRLASLRGLLLAPITVRGYEMAVTASVGGATFPIDGRSAATLLRHADAAMYRAKASGRDTLQWFDDSMVEEFNEKLELSGALRQALGDGELFVVYQPQYSLHDGCLTGFEALARWKSPTFGLVSPDRFIPVAEDSGLILTLGEWVVRQASKDIVRLQHQLGIPLQVAVNMSPRQLRGRNWLAQILAALNDAGLQPSQLALEITEGILLEDQRDVIEALKALREEGIKVVVDDFGRGYSSLAYLTRFPVDKIKIDRFFIEPIGVDPDAGPVVDAIIAIAHALNMEVVAEGVETAEQETYLREHGCDQVQGFRYSEGVSAAEAAAAPLLMPQLI
ncbi:GGDEF domain-containing protein [Nocardioides baekrokdamisoli]|uniref:GGDEF domain-containing protein n=1 Tax=Nocardioides baekrokdamisoli TaxID=1804624 RepID=A0A3G9IBD3_9ACTN|nr:bifunctional diguanylate cyclase/phosphodiesterase [Nocardioides baekrokdamisoli]BBH16127.1 GGDEF domain-containing protein [Nocardioides baekrokdamisoli]